MILSEIGSRDQALKITFIGRIRSIASFKGFGAKHLAPSVLRSSCADAKTADDRVQALGARVGCFASSSPSRHLRWYPGRPRVGATAASPARCYPAPRPARGPYERVRSPAPSEGGPREVPLP
ncbi:hypothetical protein MRX96_049842 [Rhipicephalus microplus]